MFINPSFTGEGALWTPPVVFCILLQKSPLQPMMKLYVNSYTILVVTPMLWSGQKNLIFAHFKASKVRRVQNRDFCTCQFRVLRGIFWGLFMNQKLFRIKKYMRNHQKKFWFEYCICQIHNFLIFANSEECSIAIFEMPI